MLNRWNFLKPGFYEGIKFGLLIFTDRVELFIPPRKGRRHVLRLIREMLVFEPESRGTDIRMALDTVNRALKRRSIVFFVSDFLAEPETYRQQLFVTSRHHDVVAIDLTDPLERQVPDVGLLAVEDAETGEVEWVDTSNRTWRNAFAHRVTRFDQAKTQVFSKTGVDRINVNTDRDYVLGLTAFFKERARRLSR